MGDYIFWADLLDTWQSASDGIKVLLIVTPPAFVVAVLALLLRHRAQLQMPPASSDNDMMPEQHPAPDAIDKLLLDQLTDLQTRLQNASRILKHQIPLQLEDMTSGSDDEVRERVRQIIMEEYRRNSHPSEALERVRHYLAHRERGERNASGT